MGEVALYADLRAARHKDRSRDRARVEILGRGDYRSKSVGL